MKTAAEVVVAELSGDGHVGLGEAVPYARYGESVESVLAQMQSIAGALAEGLTRAELQRALPPGAARNAIDCAYWDIEAKRSGKTAAQLAGVRQPETMTTAVTVSLDTPEAMHVAARAVAAAPLIKVKVNADDAVTSVSAVREAAPRARLIVDPNEGWSPALLEQICCWTWRALRLHC
ncbi:MAG: hypothetical protein R3C16_09875 [Hyphomonadaceae bacterium]